MFLRNGEDVLKIFYFNELFVDKHILLKNIYFKKVKQEYIVYVKSMGKFKNTINI